MTGPITDTYGSLPPDTGLRVGKVETITPTGLTVSVSGQIVKCGYVNPGALAVGQPVAILRGAASWLVLGQVSALSPPSSAVSVLNAVVTPTTNSTAVYASIPTTPTTGVTFTKFSASSLLKVELHCTFFTSAGGCGVEFGVLCNAIDTTVAMIHPGLTAGVHQQCSGVAALTGVPPGVQTIVPRFRINGGAGTITINADDRVSLAVTEVRP